MSAFRRICTVPLRSLLLNANKKKFIGFVYNNNRNQYRFLSQDSFRDKLKKLVDNDSGDNVESKTNENVSNNKEKLRLNTEASDNNNNSNSNNNGSNNNSDNSTDNNSKENSNTTNLNQIPSFNIGEIIGDIKDKVINSYYFLNENIRLAWKEMINQDQPSKIQKKVVQASSYKPVKEDTNDNNENVDEKEEELRQGGSEIVLIKDRGSAWDQMKARLQDSPIIKELYKRSKKLQDVAASTDIGKQAFQAGQSIKDKISDAREFWETSQNPIVYTVSGIVENITGQTEEGICLAEFKKLDPDFVLEEWADEIKKQLVPVIIKAHLEGNTKALKPWLGEACYKKLAADIGARRADGLTFDSNIIEVDENKISCNFLEERGYPIIQAVYAVQIINCVKNKKGEIVEGGETQVKQRFYVMLYQQCYIEETGSVQWKIVDYMLAGDVDFY